MKVLQLCNKPPQPTVDGGCIAINNISKGLLTKGVDLKIVTIATAKHPFLPDQIDPDFAKNTSIESIFVDTRINVIDAFSALVTSDSYNVSRFFSPDFNKRLIELLTAEKYDVIHLESLFMTPYIQTIRTYSEGRIILRSHNLEHLIWERLANSTGHTAKRLYLKHLAAKLKKYEYKTINEVDGIAAISFEDTARFELLKCESPLITIPFGVNLANYPYEKGTVSDTLSLFHIGAMNWEPNKEAVNWLLDEIWPALEKLGVTLHLAGRSMPKYISDQATDQLVIHGEVPRSIDFMNSHDVLIAPLLSGSGMRVKIIEAMGMGKTVITTKIGAEGINYKNKKNILIGDTAEEIIAHVKELVKEPARHVEIGTNARNLVVEKYDNFRIIDQLISFYQDV